MQTTLRPNAPAVPASEQVTSGQVWYATFICFAAWAFGVYDFVLFGTLLPLLGKQMGWDLASQAAIATWVSIGTVIVALAVGPIVDRFGRRTGVMVTVGGAGVCSALTAFFGTLGVLPLVIIRSLSGLGYGEQGVNGAYLSELYSAANDDFIVRHRGQIYSVVQGGWPIGALLAALLTSVLLPTIGWKGCFVFAGIPSLIIAFLAQRLRETPQFEKLHRLRSGSDDAQHKATFLNAFRGAALRPSLVLGGAHLLNWFTVQVFAILGTTVLINVHHVSFANSLLVLVLSNILGFVGYLVHGFFGDRFGRRNVIAIGWTMCGISFAALLFAPHDFWTVTALYGIGQFFLVGPYSCMLFFVGESFKSAVVRGTGAAFVVGIGPVGAILAGIAATTMLGNGISWQTVAFFFGAVPALLSGLCVLLAEPIAANAPAMSARTSEVLAG
jgi:MFS family permease